MSHSTIIYVAGQTQYVAAIEKLGILTALVFLGKDIERAMKKWKFLS